MSIDLNANATLTAIPPSNDPYRRGGPVAQGTVAEMVTRGLEYIAKGYSGVAVLHDAGLIDEAGIKELAARTRLNR